MRKCLLAFLLFASTAFAATHGERFTWTNSLAPVSPTSNTFYCGTASGIYTMVWQLTPAVQSFDWLTTDPVNPPTQGTKYYCAVTESVTGIESGYSNEVSFIFPVVPLPPSGLSRQDH